MKKHLLLFTINLLAVLFLLTSCIPEFVNPLVSPENTKPDPRLLGAWVEKDKQDKEGYILFLQNPKGQLLCKGFEKDAQGNPEEMEILCIPSNFDEGSFLSLSCKDVEKGATSKNFYIIKYEIRDDNLFIYHFKSEALIKAIKNKTIKGQIKTYESSFKPKNKETADIHEYPVIEDSSENLMGFIKGMKKEELFEEPGVSIRKKDKK